MSGKMLKPKLLAVAASFIILASTLFVFLGSIDLIPLESQQISGRYLSYNGGVSKIFWVATTASYACVNETYTSIDGQVVPKGSMLLVVNATLRNDYTSDDPPPPHGVPISPADGTAYVYLTAQLNSKAGVVEARDVTVPDFSIPATPGAALVLAEGQTASVDIYMAVSEKNINDFYIKLIFVGDSIPTSSL
jgi:hypothetical protein